MTARNPEWLLLDRDDNENVAVLRAPTSAAALIMVRAEYGDAEWSCQPVTPAMRRRWRYYEHKEAVERGEKPPRPSRAKPPSAEAWEWYSRLSMAAMMSLHDADGRLRCTVCARFVRLDDFIGSPTVARVGGAVVHFGPSCKRCRGEADVSRPAGGPHGSSACRS